jgi:RNA 3'-terminal phosphate cyclase-like protein
LTYIPGIITNNGGVPFDFDCGQDRSIAYYLEPLILISLFGKTDLKATLNGFTNDHIDQSVDSVLNCLIPLVKRFAPEWACTLKINRRGFRPNATGKVYFAAPFVKYLKAVDLVSRGPFKRIRGVCAGARVSTTIDFRLPQTCSTE